MATAQLYIKLLARQSPRSTSTNHFVRRITPALSPKEPISHREPNLASVAVILGRGREVTVLLIKRSERKSDPWSGQIAFPGGRVEKSDRDLRDTAVRETREEMGVDLDSGSNFLGFLGAFKVRMTEMKVVPCLFRAVSELVISTNREVSSYRWVPLGAFQSNETSTLYTIDRMGIRLAFPAFRVDDYLIWGLTERIIFNLIEFL
jgi:8-oxo-dGTP pyrophosphatase MutT (NUDIX family)